MTMVVVLIKYVFSNAIVNIVSTIKSEMMNKKRKFNKNKSNIVCKLISEFLRLLAYNIAIGFSSVTAILPIASMNGLNTE